MAPSSSSSFLLLLGSRLSGRRHPLSGAAIAPTAVAFQPTGSSASSFASRGNIDSTSYRTRTSTSTGTNGAIVAAPLVVFLWAAGVVTALTGSAWESRRGRSFRPCRRTSSLTFASYEGLDARLNTALALAGFRFLLVFVGMSIPSHRRRVSKLRVPTIPDRPLQ